MGEFAIGQGVSRFEDPRLLQGGGRYVDDIKLPGMAHGVVLRSPHAHAEIKSIDVARRERGARRAGGADRRRHARRPAGATCRSMADCKRRDGSPMHQAALSDPRRGPRALGRRPRRLRRRRDAGAGARRRRAGRGRLRAAAGGRPRPPTRPSPARRRCGTTAPDNICFVELIGDKAATDAAFAKRRPRRQADASSSTASPPTTMEPRGAVGDYDAGRRPLHALHRHPAAARRPHRPRQACCKIPESKIRVVTGDIGGASA